MQYLFAIDFYITERNVHMCVCIFLLNCWKIESLNLLLTDLKLANIWLVGHCYVDAVCASQPAATCTANTAFWWWFILIWWKRMSFSIISFTYLFRYGGRLSEINWSSSSFFRILFFIFGLVNSEINCQSTKIPVSYLVNHVHIPEWLSTART